MQIKPNKTFLGVACGIVGVAILALMVFSLDRSAWAFGMFETGRPHQSEKGLAAALVVELLVIACIVAKAVTVREIRAYATMGLIGGLVVTTLPNLWAGWVWGWDAARATMPDSKAAFAVSALAWAVINAAIPSGIYLLSEIEAMLVRVLLNIVASERTAEAAPVAETAPAHQSAPTGPHPVASAPEIAPVAPPAPRMVAEVPQPVPAPASAPAPAHRTGVLKLERTKADTWDRIITGLGAGEKLIEIAGALGISEAMVRKHRDAMLAEGVLVRDGRDYRKNGVLLEVM